MKKRIFQSTFLVSMLTFISCMVIIMGVLYRHFDNQLIKELKNEAIYVGTSVELLGDTYFESLETESRITWIDKNGTILYDNQVDKESMESHADREEYIEATKLGVGQAERYSDTMEKRTVYYAIRLADGSIIRVATTQFTVLSLLLSMFKPILAVFAVTVGLSVFLASKLSNKIVNPINSIDLDEPNVEQCYDELTPFVRKIRNQNELIALQIKNLERKQKEFSAITDNMTEGFIVIDKRTEVLSHNSAAERLLGTKVADVSRSVYAMNRSEIFRKVVENALDGKRDNRVLEREGRYLQILSNPVWSSGKISGAILIVIDVTEIEQREKLRREFTSNVSHELKTPLTSIYGLSDLLRNGLVKQDDVSEFGKNIHDETGRLIVLVNDILRVSQLDEGIGLGEKEEVDLYELSVSVLSRLQSVAKKREITLCLEGDKAKVNGYYGTISEILYNLCENAVKYNKDYGKVVVSIHDENDCVKWIVSDNGIGIKQSELDRIFERFYRVDKSHSKNIGGTGLGLSIVKHGCMCNDAEVTVSSVEGEGSIFTVSFKK